MAYCMEEAVMTQTENLYYMENSDQYHHPFSGQYSAYSLSSIPAVLAFSNCLMHTSMMLAQNHNSHERMAEVWGQYIKRKKDIPPWRLCLRESNF